MKKICTFLPVSDEALRGLPPTGREIKRLIDEALSEAFTNNPQMKKEFEEDFIYGTERHSRRFDEEVARIARMALRVGSFALQGQ